MFVKSCSWTRDSHGLFDYESKNVQKKQIRVIKSSNIIRIGNEVQLQENANIEHLDDTVSLASVSRSKGTFMLSAADDRQPLWLALRNTKQTEVNQSFILNEGTIIKLGRIKFKISALHTTELEPTEDLLPENVSEENVCRICLCDGSEIDNPLICPCLCSGTMKHIHVQCLQKWVSSKFSTKIGPNSIIFCWKSMDCELCKSAFPPSVKISGRVHNIFTAGEIHTPYLMLESMSKDNTNQRMLNLVSFINKCSFTLGRGHESDLRVSDISVSRSHASIKCVNGKFILEDNKSKFGTLVLLAHPKRIEENENLVIQAGRTLLDISIKSGIKSEDEES